MNPKGLTGWRKRRRNFRHDRRENLKRFKKSTSQNKVNEAGMTIMSFNCNGLSGKMEDLADWMDTKEVDVTFVSEVKLRSGSRFTHFSIEGYKNYEDLRLDDQGGMVMYISDRMSTFANKWDGLLDGAQSWMKSERMWVKVDTMRKIAVCSAYLKCNPGLFSESHECNMELLNQIHQETNHLRSEGYEIILMGDLNAHGGDCEQFGFEGNPHQMNTNGTLLNDWLRGQPMSCLNNREWMNVLGDSLC